MLTPQMRPKGQAADDDGYRLHGGRRLAARVEGNKGTVRGPSASASHDYGLLDGPERVKRAVRRVRKLLDRTPGPDSHRPSRFAATGVTESGHALLVAAASMYARTASLHDGTAASLIRSAQIHRDVAKLNVPDAARHLVCADACQRAADREHERAAVARKAAVGANERQRRVA